MKIKLDFVTNSSSTTFIMCVPPDFKIPSYKEIIDQAELWDYHDSDEEINDTCKGITEFLENIRAGTVESLQEEIDEPFWATMSCIPNEFIIASVYADEHCGSMVFVKFGELEDFYMSHKLNLQRIKETFFDE